jgi:hypothetical protein
MKAKHIKIILLGLLFCPVLYSQTDYSEELMSLVRIDLLPQHINNLNIRQVSSYDTTGGNDDGFSGRFSYLRKEKNGLVIAELKGPGTIKRIWTPTPNEDTIQFFFDKEKEPRINMKFIELFNGDVYPFSRPVVGNEVGGYYCYLPIPFQSACKIVLKGKVMQFIQIDYAMVAGPDIRASFPKKLSVREMETLARVIEIWKKTGKEVLDLLNYPSGEIQKRSTTLLLKPGEATSLYNDTDGGRVIGFEIVPQSDFNESFKDVILSAEWDNDKVPAINCPVTDFFGYAFGKPSMQSILLGVNNRLHYCFIPMPYRSRADLKLEYLKNEYNAGKEISCKVTVYFNDSGLKPDEGKLYVKWNRDNNIEKGNPYKILETEGRGNYIGTLLQAQGLNSGMTLFFEGDDECTIDGQLRLHGTGSEDYFNGGWYALADRWDQAFSLPVHGSLAYSIPLAHTGGYRFYVSDKLSFEKSFKLAIEHGGVGNNIPADYTSAAFYYCDRPLPENEKPSNELLAAIKSPKTLEYWLALLPVRAFSEDSEITKEKWTDTKTKKGYEALKFSAAEDGFIKFGLDVPGGGEYKLFISYFRGPACADFQVNQRQIPIKNCKGFAEQKTFIEKEYIGTMNIKSETNTITITLKGNSNPLEIKSFVLHRIYLEKV